jgi:trehalose/maltose hydrolase-like predicted phosphorylase
MGMHALARTIDALLVDIDALTAHDRQGALRRRLSRLIAAHLGVGLLTHRSLGELDGTLDALHRDGGPVLLAAGGGAALYELSPAGALPHPTRAPGGTTSGRAWDGVLAAFARLGISAENTLFLGPGPAALCGFSASLADAERLLDEQLHRRETKRVPTVTEASGWTVTDTGSDPHRPGAQAAVFTLGDGVVGTRGVVEEDPGGSAVLAAGTYIGTGSKQHLRPAPGWTALDLSGASGPERRVLDLRTGLLFRDELEGDLPLRTVRFASSVRQGIQALRAEASDERLSAGPPLQPPAEGGVEGGRDEGVTWAHTVGDVGGVSAVAVQDVIDEAMGDRRLRVVERLAAYRADSRQVPSVDDALEALSDAAKIGFDALLAEHRREWARRWAMVDIEIPDDPSAEQAFRFALFQLWSNVGCPSRPDGTWNGEERGVGARGLSGQGYGGHVFWDADVFALPAVTTMCPAAGRAMIEYRLRRLPSARARAAAGRRQGARFPWESARDGEEVTPTSGLLGKEILKIRTGELEEHIVADVAWGADRYATWTGDTTLLHDDAYPLVVETARYWASRITLDSDGRGHLTEVIGPDEYHEGVDDNVFTNVMARWNLRRGADLNTDLDEGDAWRVLADALVDGYDPATGRHEQFAGYNDLEPLTVDGIAPLPFAADLVLGRGRAWRSQLIKQPDVLMAHFLVPRDMRPGSLGPDLDYYVPRTSHGSSLSPAITAGLLARAGRPDDALDALRLALRLDLDDITRSSTSGLHLATIGGTWWALVDGFLGLDVRDGVLHADPHLPSEWGTVRARLQVLRARIEMSISASELAISSDRLLRLHAAGSSTTLVSPGARIRYEKKDGCWRRLG